MRDDIPTIPASDLRPDRTPSLSIPRAARNCYELLADVERWSEWLPGMLQVRTLVRTVRDRTCEAVLAASLGNQRLGGRIGIAFGERALALGFRSHPDARVQLAGAAQFRVDSETSCTLLYRVQLNTAPEARVPAGAVPDAHSVMAAFVAFAQRTIPSFPEGSAPHERPRAPTSSDVTEPGYDYDELTGKHSRLRADTEPDRDTDADQIPITIHRA